MPIALIIFGVLAIVVGLRGNYVAVAGQISKDLSGSGNFFLWIGAILFLAVVGRVLDVPGASKMFITLILVVYLISNSGVFTQLESAFANMGATSASAASAPAPASPTPSTNDDTSSSFSSSGIPGAEVGSHR